MKAIRFAPSNEELARMHREYMNAIQPIIQAKCKMHALMIPRITISGGEVKREYDYTEDQKRLLREADEYIEQIKRQIYAPLEDQK